jgi:hypothetical protein
MKKSKLLREVASVKIHKSFRDAINDVGETMTKQHFDVVAAAKKQATAQKARAKAAAAKATQQGRR